MSDSKPSGSAGSSASSGVGKTFLEKRDDHRFSINIPWKGIFVAVGLFFLVAPMAGCVGFMVIYHFAHAAAVAPPPLPPTFKPVVCTNRQVLDYRNDDPPNGDLQIPVREGCFAYEVYLPEAWDEMDGSGGTTSGDYIAVWCAGKGRPTILLWWFNFSFGKSLTGCRDTNDKFLHFLVEGKVTPTTDNPYGRIHFYMTRRHRTTTQRVFSFLRGGS